MNCKQVLRNLFVVFTRQFQIVYFQRLNLYIYVHIKGEIKLLNKYFVQAQISKFSKITIHLKFVNYEL